MLDENLYQAGTSCAGTDANKAVLPWSSLMRAHGFRRNMPARRRSCVSRSGNQVGCLHVQVEITSGNQQSCLEISFLERAHWKSAQLAASAHCTSALRIVPSFVETHSMDRERSPRRSQWRLPTPTPPQSWQGGRPAYPAVQPQNLPWQPNPRLAQMLSAPMAPQIPGAPPPPRTSTPVGHRTSKCRFRIHSANIPARYVDRNRYALFWTAIARRFRAKS